MNRTKKLLATVFGLACAMSAGGQSATDLLGSTIRDENGRDVGEVADLLIEDGAVVAVELIPDDSLELEGERIEVPYGSLRIDADGVLVVARSQVVLLASAARDPDTQAPETLPPLDVDEDLAEIDPRLAEGIEANEEAYETDLDEESFDNDAERSLPE